MVNGELEDLDDELENLTGEPEDPADSKRWESPHADKDRQRERAQLARFSKGNPQKCEVVVIDIVSPGQALAGGQTYDTGLNKYYNMTIIVEIDTEV